MSIMLGSRRMARAAASDPMQRLFNSDVGIQAINAVGNETRTLAALERLSLEIVAQSLRLTGQAGEADRILVMSRRAGWPPILMLMSPKIVSLEESRIVSDDLDLPFETLLMGLNEAVDLDQTTPEALALQKVLASGVKSLPEIFLISQPEVVLTRRPRMIPLSVASPHIRVESGETLSTAGMLCRDVDGELGVTACFHGTGGVGTEVTIGLEKGQVKRASELQDIVFIPLGKGFGMPELVGLRGVRKDREPARSDRVHFDGAINSNCTTRIFGADAGLLRARPTIMLKLQTDPDTDQGDSGSALLDEDDYVLGFAFERTDYNDYPQFTDWIWAANALRALELTPIIAGA
jgi:hypothetical protein